LLVKSQSPSAKLSSIEDATWADVLVSAYIDGTIAQAVAFYARSVYDANHPITVHILLATGTDVEVTQQIASSWEKYAEYFSSKPASLQVPKIRDFLGKLA
jgi:hypothetical protein